MRKPPRNNGTLPMFAPAATWQAPNLSDLPDWSRAKRIGFDTEFKDPTLRTLGCGARRGAKLAGISFKLDGDAKAYYVPLRHPGEGNVDLQQGLRYFQDNAARFKGELIGANMSGDLDICHYEGIKFSQQDVIMRDIQIAGPLIWELHRNYSLKAEAARRGFQGKDDTVLKEWAIAYGAEVYHRTGKNKGKEKQGWQAIIPDLPCHAVGPYGEHDAAILLPVYAEQEKILASKGLTRVMDLESRLLPVLLKIRQRGVLIDWDQLDRIEKWAAQEERETLIKIHALTGINIGFDNCMQADACAMALHAAGVNSLGRTEAGQWQVTTAVLAAIQHPVAALIRYCRQVYKLRRTFVASIRRHATNGRIHGTLQQIVGTNEKNEKTGAAFGRLSHKNPNTAQQPSMAKFALMWRKIFLPEPGAIWGVNDLSQQEPRWTTHFAAKYGCDGAAEAAREYCNNPRVDNHDYMAKLTGLERKWAKFVFLALCYGEGGRKLCQHQLKLPTRWRVTFGSYKTGIEERFFGTEEEAIRYRKSRPGKARILEVAGEEGQRILDTFSAKAPYIKQLSDLAMEKAEKFGYIKILGGRTLNFPLARDGSYDYTYKTLNRLIQGTSGYQVKLWMLAVDREMPDTWIQLQRHDDIAGSFGSRAECKRVGHIGRDVVKALVPFRVDTECGTSDGDIHQLCASEECVEVSAKNQEGKYDYWCPVHQQAA